MIATVRTKEGPEEVTAYYVYEWQPRAGLKFGKKKGRSSKPVKTEYCLEFATLDTETSHSDDITGWVYQWAAKFDGQYIIGRKPAEIILFFQKLIDFYELGENREIIVYIHNSSYDLQYLKRYILDAWPDADFLCTDTHSMLSVSFSGIRILDSYKLSNMGLDLFSRSYASKYLKAVGEIDYTVVRYQDSRLSAKDWDYQLSDVASQHDAITGYINAHGYNYAYQAPITSTGFVRKDCQRRSVHEKMWRREFLKGQLTLEQYEHLRRAFMGGLTIASWKYAGQTVRGDLAHLDFASSYPARQMTCYFPHGKPMWEKDVITDPKLLDYHLRHHCCIFRLALLDVHLKEGITAPVIPSSKCIILQNPMKDNGKVCRADLLCIIVTEIDYKWIRKQYEFKKMHIDRFLYFERGPAPRWMKSAVMDYFRAKCELKAREDADGKRMYAASKAHLNSIYGMTATALIRPAYHLDDEGTIVKGAAPEKVKEPAAELEAYYNKLSSFMPYQLGVYTTAHARDALMTTIEAVGYDNFLYCDTDSVFYLRTEENEKRLSVMNEKIKSRAIACGAYVGEKYLGYAEPEAPIRAFRALHAKCYAVEEQDKKGNWHLSATIAGIPKRSTKWIDGQPVTMTNDEELKDIDNLKEGLVFTHCGGTRTVYAEMPVRTETINGHETELASSAVIENISKVLSNGEFVPEVEYVLGENELPHYIHYEAGEI